jgi:hypothetical protein
MPHLILNVSSCTSVPGALAGNGLDPPPPKPSLHLNGLPVIRDRGSTCRDRAADALSIFKKILKRSIWKKYVKNRLSWYESSRLHVIQQSTSKCQTIKTVFENSYLILISFKWNFLNNLGELDKISTWKKYKFLNKNLYWTRGSDPAAAAQRDTLFFPSIFENL